MANDDLDLNVGEPDLEARRALRRERSSEQAKERSSRSERAATKLDNEMRSQLSRALEGIAKSREAHDDDELADAIREETDAMSDGIVALTANVTFLRLPILILLNVAITVLAFGRVGGILYGRATMRRQLRTQEQELAQAQWEAEQAANA